MKKLLAALLLLLLAVPAVAQTTSPAEQTYVFLVPSADNTCDVTLAVDADVSEAVALLGEPLSYFESASCAFQGLDKVYTYPSFIISTYPQDGLDLIMSIYVMDDVYTTAEGAYIGMHVDEVTAIYGEPTTSAEGSVSYEKAGCALAFIHDADGYITAITYSSIAASAQ